MVFAVYIEILSIADIYISHIHYSIDKKIYKHQKNVPLKIKNVILF